MKTFRDYILEFKARNNLTSADVARIIDKKMSLRCPEAWIVAKDPAIPNPWAMKAIFEKLNAYEKRREVVLKKLSKAELKMLKVE